MASHVRIATRGMHTGGRRVPFPGLGGAGKVPPATGGSVSTAINALKPDSRHPPQPDVSAGLSRGLLQHAGFIPRRNRRHVTPALDPPELRDYTVHGKPILHRPPRTIPVNLPSGYPEPPTYPPPQEYLDTVKERRQPAHRLWQFFHLTEEAKEALPVAGQKAPRMGDSLNLRDKDNLSGRSWLISELRAKSFADLHVLWYVLLKERNVLETQKLERRRVEVPTGYDKDMIVPRLRKVRVAMARIKLVLNERRLALLAATGPHWDRIEREKAAESERETAAAIAEGRPLPKPVRVAAAPEWSDPRGTQMAIRVPLEERPDYNKIVRSVPKLWRDRKKLRAAAVEEDDVNEAEVEARDEGFGGGDEAEEFVEGVDIDEDGQVKRIE